MILSFADKETENIQSAFFKEDSSKHSKDCLEETHDD